MNLTEYTFTKPLLIKRVYLLYLKGYPTEELAKEAQFKYADFLNQVNLKGQFYL